MRISLALAAGLITALPANAEPLEYAVYRLTEEGQTDGGRTLIAQGKLDYSMADVDVVEWGKQDPHPTWLKSVALPMGFDVGLFVVRDSEVPGFGLWIGNLHHPQGFSWEWFDVESGDIYRKLQGEGSVRVTQAQYPDGVEIQSVEFLTDITLRFQEDMRKGPGKKTHVVVVSKGSILRFGP